MIVSFQILIYSVHDALQQLKRQNSDVLMSKEEAQVLFNLARYS
jgi:hypothetical protein